MVCYQATFKPAVKKGSSQEFDVVATITGMFKANPAKIEQTERQYVEYLDNLYLLSPYPVLSQTTVVSRTCAGVSWGGPCCCICPAARGQGLARGCRMRVLHTMRTPAPEGIRRSPFTIHAPTPAD